MVKLFRKRTIRVIRVSILPNYSRMRSEKFPFIVWGFGAWTCVRVVCAGSSPCPLRLVAGGSLIPCRGGCWWACRVCGAVPWGLVTRASSGRRRVFGIAGQGVVGGAVSF